MTNTGPAFARIIAASTKDMCAISHKFENHYVVVEATRFDNALPARALVRRIETAKDDDFDRRSAAVCVVCIAARTGCHRGDHAARAETQGKRCDSFSIRRSGPDRPAVAASRDRPSEMYRLRVVRSRVSRISGPQRARRDSRQGASCRPVGLHRTRRMQNLVSGRRDPSRVRYGGARRRHSAGQADVRDERARASSSRASSAEWV